MAAPGRPTSRPTIMCVRLLQNIGVYLHYADSTGADPGFWKGGVDKDFGKGGEWRTIAVPHYRCMLFFPPFLSMKRGVRIWHIPGCTGTCMYRLCVYRLPTCMYRLCVYRLPTCMYTVVMYLLASSDAGNDS